MLRNQGDIGAPRDEGREEGLVSREKAAILRAALMKLGRIDVFRLGEEKPSSYVGGVLGGASLVIIIANSSESSITSFLYFFSLFLVLCNLRN